MSDTYSFKTVLNGLEVEVLGEFSPEEPQTRIDPGCPAEFEIKNIKPVGKEFEVDSVPWEYLEEIEQAAFAAKTDDLNQEPF